MLTLSSLASNEILINFLKIAADADTDNIGVKITSNSVSESVCLYMKPSTLLDLINKNINEGITFTIISLV